MAVRLSALRTRRTSLPRNIIILIFLVRKPKLYTGLSKLCWHLNYRNHLFTKHTSYVQDDLQGGLNLFYVVFNAQKTESNTTI
jgi:hypothetical protein